jgi:hypothetical protein
MEYYSGWGDEKETEQLVPRLLKVRINCEIEQYVCRTQAGYRPGVILWSCGAVDLWICGSVELWSCGAVVEKEHVPPMSR